MTDFAVSVLMEEASGFKVGFGRWKNPLRCNSAALITHDTVKTFALKESVVWEPGGLMHGDASCHGQIQSFQAEGAGKESRQGTDFSVGSLMKFWTLIRAPMLSSMLTSSVWTGSSTTTQPHSLVVLTPLQITISYIFLSSSSINIFLTY